MRKIARYTIEELEEGMVAEIEHQITSEKINAFAELTNDYHPLHVSKSYALENGFENIIAHGLLISSFSSALIGMKMPGENAIIISQSFKYRKPAYPGTILLIKGILEKIDIRSSLLEIKIKIKSKDKNQLIATGNYLVKVRTEK